MLKSKYPLVLVAIVIRATPPVSARLRWDDDENIPREPQPADFAGCFGSGSDPSLLSSTIRSRHDFCCSRTTACGRAVPCAERRAARGRRGMLSWCCGAWHPLAPSSQYCLRSIAQRRERGLVTDARTCCRARSCSHACLLYLLYDEAQDQRRKRPSGRALCAASFYLYLLALAARPRSPYVQPGLLTDLVGLRGPAWVPAARALAPFFHPAATRLGSHGVLERTYLNALVRLRLEPHRASRYRPRGRSLYLQSSCCHAS